MSKMVQFSILNLKRMILDKMEYEPLFVGEEEEMANMS